MDFARFQAQGLRNVMLDVGNTGFLRGGRCPWDLCGCMELTEGFWLYLRGILEGEFRETSQQK